MQPYDSSRDAQRMRRWFLRLFGVWLMAGLIGWAAQCPQRAWAVDPTTADTPQDVTVERTSERLHFKVPADWPIEKRGGVTAPIPIEEYLARKFKALEGSVQSMEQRVNGLDLRLRVVEEEKKKQTSGLKPTEPARP